MIFAEYYNKKNKFNNHNILLEHEIQQMPTDVYADLMEHLGKDDGTIGVFSRNENGILCAFVAMDV